MATQTELNARKAYVAKRDNARANAARAMLAALEMAERMTGPHGRHFSAARREQLHRMASEAIATAKAAGIASDE